MDDTNQLYEDLRILYLRMIYELALFNKTQIAWDKDLSIALREYCDQQETIKENMRDIDDNDGLSGQLCFG